MVGSARIFGAGEDGSGPVWLSVVGGQLSVKIKRPTRPKSGRMGHPPAERAGVPLLYH